MGIFKAYDVRGKFPGDWEADMAYRIGRSLPALLEADKILVGRDARDSSPIIMEALSRGITEAGADVIDMGLSTTPMVYFATAKFDYPASVMITASHNPPAYNGLKISRSKAVPVGYDTGLNELEKMVEALPPKGESKGSVTTADYRDDYSEHLLSFSDGIKPMKVVVDYGNGMVGLLHEKVFKKTSLEIIPIYSDVDGRFPNHEPNPTLKENLHDVAARIRKEKADLGIAFDGDGDRVVFLDENGKFISPDLIIAVLASELLPAADKGQTVLYDVRSSRSVPEAVSKLGGNPVMWRVGHAYMKKKLRDDNGILGGELAGHYYFRDNSFCDSGALAAIIGLKAFSKAGIKASYYVAALSSRAFSGEINFSIDDKAAVIDRLKKVYTDGKLTDIDGIRMDMEDWWFNVRASNTEPLLRLVVEAKNRYQLNEKIGEISAVIAGEPDSEVKREGWNDSEAPMQLVADTIRIIAAECVQRANSGHPGMPMGMADAAALIWMKYLKVDPTEPDWVDRDRFVLSGGHGSTLHYTLLHLAGFDVPMQELESFRQWGSMTPGHPERGETPGIELTTGPLGQGMASAVGMAMAEKMLGARINGQIEDSSNHLIDHRTWVFAGDGDMQEGVTSEAASLAGHLKLGGLKVVYDDNHISIDGPTDMSFSEDVCARFDAYGWKTIKADGHDFKDMERAFDEACSVDDRPVLIALRTTIGKGSPNKCNTSGVHGSPLGDEELSLVKDQFGWPKRMSAVPPSVRKSFALRAQKWAEMRMDWNGKIDRLKGKNYPVLMQLENMLSGDLPAKIDEILPEFPAGKSMATRKASGEVLNALSPAMPSLIGGSADLTPSNNTRPKEVEDVTPGNFAGSYLRFGIREHAMASIMNGIAAHGGFRVYGGTFLVFSDYLRPALRLAGMMKLPVIHVLTHDSIFLGEDGPTHQPDAHIASMRAMPNVIVMRPCDASETAQAWKAALQIKKAPVVLALTRQGLPELDRNEYPSAVNLRKGAYILKDTDGKPDVIIIGTGSEVHTALDAVSVLAEKGVKARVVAMPCWKLFEHQSEEYRLSVLPEDGTPRVAVEAGNPFGWERWTGRNGIIIGLENFGASAPAKVLAEKFGFTGKSVADRIMNSGLLQSK